MTTLLKLDFPNLSIKIRLRIIKKKNNKLRVASNNSFF